jgi:pimeloyl-ACP methyl ester carboxylesterase
VFIHGTPWSSRVWVPFAEALASSFRIYLFDNPGYGRSPGAVAVSPHDKHDLDGSLAGQAEAFAYLLKHWNLSQPPHVIAHDNGGLCALRASLTHGVEYASLCLIDVVAASPFGSTFFKLVAANHNVFNAIPQELMDGLISAYIQGAAFKPLSSEILDMLLFPWTAAGVQGKAGFLRQMKQADQRYGADVEPRYGEIGKKIPVKIIWGKEDAWLSVDRAKKLAHMIGTNEVVIVENAGHLIHYDQPTRLATELTSWLSKVASLK